MQQKGSIAVLGTASDVGKSFVVTALCRILKEEGYSVAPFKAQNMSNNSFVTAEGGEIGRAQVAQAEAAGLLPSVDMNPILLKPMADNRSALILHGQEMGTHNARRYFGRTNELFEEAYQALKRLQQHHDCIVLEGAGSCAEVNLRDRDLVNFRMARAAEASVILTADIDRGGVFAQIIGTLAVLTEEERAQVRGLLINRFRGDRSLFDDGVQYLEQETGLPVLGVLPWFQDLELDAEDAVPLQDRAEHNHTPRRGRINIAVLLLPHISNFTDFAPLQLEPSVNLRYLREPRELEGFDLVLLPGTRNVRGDLDWLRSMGWEPHLRTHVQGGGQLGGLCGGYQLLGERIEDPEGAEGDAGSSEGLGLLPLQTTLTRHKTLTRTQGVCRRNRQAVSGYEIHIGQTQSRQERICFLEVAGDTDPGAQDESGRVWGCYLHGLFDQGNFRQAFLSELRPDLQAQIEADEAFDYRARREAAYDRMAASVREHLDVREILRWLK